MALILIVAIALIVMIIVCLPIVQKSFLNIVKGWDTGVFLPLSFFIF